MNSKINCDVWIRHTSCLMEGVAMLQIWRSS